ncbi:MlaC/ttg2D family ABC transporter substrate-binding protein [Kiloniella litopenaei]|uniref:MlaC/ttg2D family ABC transporter substrate-binding protein n=1 Tax=Kiloniella litopenaei TaxID=1549748 RepID=UPI000698318E|nr:ABC transporter substrate-binding protein [Kiloniella litopenaei]
MKHISCFIKNIAALLAGAAFCLAAFNGTANADDDAGLFLKALQEKAITQLSNEDVSEEEREKQFRTLLNENFDVEGIARFVIGKYWRKAETEHRDEFIAIFEDIMVQRFLPTFNQYAGSDFEVTKVVPKKSFFIVFSTVKTENGEPAQILWRVEKKDEASSHIVTDIAAEGISLRSTYRSDYTSALKSLGGDLSALNSKLRKKVQSGDFAPKESS